MGGPPEKKYLFVGVLFNAKQSRCFIKHVVLYLIIFSNMSETPFPCIITFASLLQYNKKSFYIDNFSTSFVSDRINGNFNGLFMGIDPVTGKFNSKLENVKSSTGLSLLR